MEKQYECPIGEWNLVVSYAGNNKDEISDEIVHWVGIIPCEEFYVDGWDRYFIVFNMETENEALRKEVGIYRGMSIGKLKCQFLSSVVATKDLWNEDGEIKGNDNVMLSTNTVTND